MRDEKEQVVNSKVGNGIRAQKNIIS